MQFLDEHAVFVGVGFAPLQSLSPAAPPRVTVHDASLPVLFHVRRMTEHLFSLFDLPTWETRNWADKAIRDCCSPGFHIL